MKQIKLFLLVSVLSLISFVSHGQALTNDQKSVIGSSATFQDRIATVLREKALYWQNAGSATRASVNKQLQKRKRLAKQILTSSYVEGYKALVAQYWITQYSDGNPALDGNGIPTSAAISASFDPTFDFWAGYVSGDENLTEIEW